MPRPTRERRKRLLAAYAFAKTAHTGQKRRYTGAAYIVHPLSVAKRLSAYTQDEALLSAALLHDTVEDTDVSAADIQCAFGHRVACLVEQLSNPSRFLDKRRCVRKAIDRAHIAQVSADAQTIKVFDIIDNLSDVVQHDPQFARIYLAEKRLMLDAMTKAPAHVKSLGWYHWKCAASLLPEPIQAA
ncbi:HD domain-containing protein [Acidihalobacter ferrooxydans]|uniref:HD/PDEase domain-containing protein n=1 Tax=Acidihalobacter ferrooxydans TaxID=1765967 RepID=A0A1P8UFQ6_9GAMM|nr:HD domain-containing protein [Acidihalobacter ferrooxydans]APZ42621.1 hypothetical protein BW247_05510 [Acidihalobacter ferrooxydans]